MQEDKELFYYKVRIDTMDKMVPVGSIVLIEQTNHLKDGDIVLFLFESGEEGFYRIRWQEVSSVVSTK